MGIELTHESGGHSGLALWTGFAFPAVGATVEHTTWAWRVARLGWGAAQGTVLAYRAVALGSTRSTEKTKQRCLRLPGAPVASALATVREDGSGLHPGRFLGLTANDEPKGILTT